MKARPSKGGSTAKGSISTATEWCTKGSSIKANFMAKECSPTPTEVSIKANGNTANSRRASISSTTDSSMRTRIGTTARKRTGDSIRKCLTASNQPERPRCRERTRTRTTSLREPTTSGKATTNRSNRSFTPTKGKSKERLRNQRWRKL